MKPINNSNFNINRNTATTHNAPLVATTSPASTPLFTASEKTKSGPPVGGRPSGDAARYEQYKLQWMIEHNLTLTNLVEELEAMRHEDEASGSPRRTLMDLYSAWEFGVGFVSGQMWDDYEVFKRFTPNDTMDKRPNGAPPVLAHWITVGKTSGGANILQCSHCKRTRKGRGKSAFCPDCGADMSEEVPNNG